MELEGPGEGIIGHEEHGEDGVHGGEDDDQAVEAVPHLAPENKKNEFHVRNFVLRN